MTHDSDERRKPAQSDGEPETTTFGWHPDVPEPTQIEQRQSDLDQATEPAVFTGPSLIGEPAPEQPAYWTPARPGELPPTIIRRKAPASAREMLTRYSKPAMMALTVAAVSSAGLLESAQTAIAQAANSADNDDGVTPNVRPSEAEERSETYQLQTDSELDNDDQATGNNTTTTRTEPFIYTVETGDWVRHIARDFGLQTMTVVWNNDLPDPDYILPGQELLILPVDGVMIEVQEGETLNGLATMFGVNTTAIINYEPNGITDPDLIQPGQILIIPGGVPPQAVTQQFSGSQSDATAAPAQETAQTSEPVAQATEPAPDVQETAVAEFSSAGATTTVAAGDTLASIAEGHGISVAALLQVNDLADVDSIFPGDTLYLPEGVQPEPEPQPEASTDTTVEPASEPEPAPAPEPDPAPEPAESAPAPEPDPTPTPEPPPPAPEPTATAQPDPTPTPEPPPVDTGPPSDIPSLLEYYANQYGLDPNLIKAVAWRESGWNQSSISSAGAIGVMQVMPGTADWINNNLVSRHLDVRGSARDNIEAGTAYLSHRISQFGDVEHGLAAYFMGPATVQNYGITATGRQYVDRILEIRDYIAANGGPPSWR